MWFVRHLFKIGVSTIFLLSPIVLMAQEQQEETSEAETQEDPFKRLFIFGPSIEDLLEDPGFEIDESDLVRSARYIANTGIDLGAGFEAGPYYTNALYSQYPNLPAIHFNRVNGLFFSIKKERMQWHRRSTFLTIPEIQPHGFVGIGTATGTIDYAFGLDRLFGERERFMLGTELHRATATEDYWRTGLIENTLTSLFAGYDYLDYYRLYGFGIYAVYRTNRLIEAAFSYNANQVSTLQQETTFSLFGYSNTYRPNPPVDANSDQINIDSYSFSLSLNPRNILMTNEFAISTTVGMELADNARTDSGYRYSKYWADAKVFFNVDEGSVLNWRLRAEFITGTAPDYKAAYLGGIGSLRGTPYKFYSGNQSVLSNMELKIGTPGHTEGRWLRTYNLHFLAFLDSGWVQQNEELVNGNYVFNGFNDATLNNFQHDAGVGIGNGALRFEIAWPLNNFDPEPRVWIRFNPTF
ncbi:BamA/TamA family outer membrane protein [soil metagenome]